ncbi:MFS general substrate transporter, partial [Aureobasidium melanogenum]
MIPVIALMPESYTPVLLSRKAKKLRQETGDQDIIAKTDLQKKTLRHVVTVVMTRPYRMLFNEVIVMCTCAYCALAYGIFYLYFEAYPIIFQGPNSVYGWSWGVSGLAFLPIGIGSVFAAPIFLGWDAYLAKAQKQNAKWAHQEEYRRLPLACLGGPLYVVSLLWIGWSAKPGTHWLAPVASGVTFGMAFQLIFMALLNYLSDSYMTFAASAQGIASTCRSIFGALLPLASNRMFSSLGVAWACSLLAFLSLGMCLIPFAFIKYGDRIRDNSVFCKELKEMMAQEAAEQEREEAAAGATALAVNEGKGGERATVMSLRDYFSEAAGQDLLSISYNPDAKYAFVNFSTESARLRAIEHAASQLFEGRRLDCRIRQDATSRSTKVNYGLKQMDKRSIAISCEHPNDPLQDAEQLSHFPEADRSQFGKEKYFIIKSGSLDALSQSLESGQWFIPNRHVKRLNHAFQTAERVYFIFSVNGSRQFFGYASMKSEIQPSTETSFRSNDVHRAPAAIEQTSQFSPVEPKRDLSLESRSRTYSLASSDSSAGSIYYEPERRRVIWEAAHHDLDRGSLSYEPASPYSTSQSPMAPEPQNVAPWSTNMPTTRVSPPGGFPASPFSPFSPFDDPRSKSTPRSDLVPFSSPCPVKWLSVNNISFDAVRGLTNAWNGNKDIYVARNVTAVDPSAAAVLLQLFQAGSAESRPPAQRSWSHG